MYTQYMMNAPMGHFTSIPGINQTIVNSMLTHFITALVPRITYYSRVGLELGKLVVQQRGMAPPYEPPSIPPR